MSDAPKINYGGPAFPEIGNIAYHSDWVSEAGMTLRDYYAAHAPITFSDAASCYGSYPNLADDADRACFFAIWAFLRVQYADAMIAEQKGAAS